MLKLYFICMEVTHENDKGNGRTAFKIPAFSHSLYWTRKIFVFSFVKTAHDMNYILNSFLFLIQS